MSILEGRYRLLLRAYPARYRDDRGDEMLGTLLEASSPGQTRPTVRDARTLVLGGLRTRAGLAQSTSYVTSMRQAVLLAAVISVVLASALELIAAREREAAPLPWPFSPPICYVLVVLMLAASVGPWFGRRPIIVALAIVAMGLLAFQVIFSVQYFLIAAVLGLAAIVVWAGRLPRLPWSWLALALVSLLVTLLNDGVPGIPALPLISGLSFAVAVITLVWSIVDARPLAALVLWLTLEISGFTVRSLTFGIGPSNWWTVMLLPVSALLATAMATWVVRRQAVL